MLLSVILWITCHTFLLLSVHLQSADVCAFLSWYQLLSHSGSVFCLLVTRLNKQNHFGMTQQSFRKSEGCKFSNHHILYQIWKIWLISPRPCLFLSDIVSALMRIIFMDYHPFFLISFCDKCVFHYSGAAIFSSESTDHWKLFLRYYTEDCLNFLQLFWNWFTIWTIVKS